MHLKSNSRAEPASSPRDNWTRAMSQVNCSCWARKQQTSAGPTSAEPHRQRGEEVKARETERRKMKRSSPVPSPIIMLPCNRPDRILLCWRVACYFRIRQVLKKLNYCLLAKRNTLYFSPPFKVVSARLAHMSGTGHDLMCSARCPHTLNSHRHGRI